MKVGIVIYRGETETIWNAFRIANFSLAMGDEVKTFIIGRAVEFETMAKDSRFNIGDQIQVYLRAGGKLFACGTCIEIHGVKPTELYKVSTLKDAHEIIKESDKVLTF